MPSLGDFEEQRRIFTQQMFEAQQRATEIEREFRRANINRLRKQIAQIEERKAKEKALKPKTTLQKIFGGASAAGAVIAAPFTGGASLLALPGAAAQIAGAPPEITAGLGTLGAIGAPLGAIAAAQGGGLNLGGFGNFLADNPINQAVGNLGLPNFRQFSTGPGSGTLTGYPIGF